jgi:hypothetical protein
MRQLTDLLTRALRRGGAQHLLEKLLGGKRRAERPSEDGQQRDPLDDSLRDLFGH